MHYSGEESIEKRAAWWQSMVESQFRSSSSSGSLLASQLKDSDYPGCYTERKSQPRANHLNWSHSTSSLLLRGERRVSAATVKERPVRSHHWARNATCCLFASHHARPESALSLLLWVVEEIAGKAWYWKPGLLSLCDGSSRGKPRRLDYSTYLENVVRKPVKLGGLAKIWLNYL